MELKKFINKIFGNFRLILSICAFGILLGTGVYLLPNRFVASGAIYVGRVTDKNNSFFTYEGYYGQQTAMAYTNSVLGLLQSTDLLKDTLAQLGRPTDEISIWKLKSGVSSKKSGPQTQVINLITRGKTQEEAVQVWNTVFSNLEKYTSKTSTQSDPALRIFKVTDNVVVVESFKSFGLDIFMGIAFSLISYITYAIIKNYFKD